MNAKAVGVGVDFDQFGNQTIHIHASVGPSRRAAVRRARSDERLRALGFIAVCEVVWRDARRHREKWRELEDKLPHPACVAMAAARASDGTLARSLAMIRGRCFNK